MSRAPSSLAAHLASSRLAGRVATPVRSCVDNCRHLVAGHPDSTFGLSDWRTASYDDAVAALGALGVDLTGGGEDPDALPEVDAEVAAAALAVHRTVVDDLRRRQGRVLFATGHAFALLPHYAAMARALAAAGCTVVEPLGDKRRRFTMPDGEPASIRYFDGVASLVVHGSLRHTHRPDYMEAMLDELGGPGGVDVVVGDHGYAGAAIEAGVRTIAIADVNDPALPLAQARGRTDGVVVIDDGLNPPFYEPLTSYLLGEGTGA